MANKRKNESSTDQPKPKRRRLSAPRPFPIVPASVSATGPRSAHKEGKNLICVTRKMALGAYMRRCKDLALRDGYKTLHLSAMGAAIPHLVKLALALPPILPFEVRTEYTTGTVEVHDEVDGGEDGDVAYETRGKSTLMVVMSFEPAKVKGGDGNVVVAEPEQEQEDVGEAV
ncbi:uncharacterized protein BT62DRAFT_41093 [Guyanagaster necrorhizus]|uniref:Uncharacterized protein n=1 Tax=Guyanagaster necrorhizus TaxID=856835 RepID=A0A9P8AYU2_9AGAR|nr:uncharacterized protein BT62DRAFT_41093 [Guyanagaster necrorhizus MCA 3950]KAG7453003.1 hypothetical protein BT62DRAFT_41093 [Guyanagaster necrorhizus MCA 3950]